jgi:hypothetical protein
LAVYSPTRPEFEALIVKIFEIYIKKKLGILILYYGNPNFHADLDFHIRRFFLI